MAKIRTLGSVVVDMDVLPLIKNDEIQQVLDEPPISLHDPEVSNCQI